MDPWYWTAWSLSGENAMVAEEIYSELPIHTMMYLYGIKIHGDSFKPKLT